MVKRHDRRNLHACHPIMRKGGAHEKSKSAKRAAAKHETRRKTTEWLSRSFFWLRFQELMRGLCCCLYPIATNVMWSL